MSGDRGGHRIPDGSGGFTLVELLVVMAIIGILASVAMPRFTAVTTQANTAKAYADMRAIVSALEMYNANNGEYPASLDLLARPVNGGPYLRAVPVPPAGWGNGGAPAYYYDPGRSDAGIVAVQDPKGRWHWSDGSIH